jgi:hypothetical protein
LPIALGVKRNMKNHQVSQPASARVRISRYQKAWLVAFWVAAALNLLSVVRALFGGVAFGQPILTVLFGAVAVVAGAMMVTAISRKGVSDIDFDDAAKGMRIVAVAWLLLAASLFIGAIVATDFGAHEGLDNGPLEALIRSVGESVSSQIFGLAAIFVVAGDGYGKYHKLTRNDSPNAKRSD